MLFHLSLEVSVLNLETQLAFYLGFITAGKLYLN